MSDEDIKKKVAEAEKFADEDKKQKELVEAKNNAESMIYQTEKTLKDLGDKVTEDEKKNIEEKIEELRTAIGSDDTETITQKTETLTQEFYQVSQRMYENTGEAAGQQAEGNADDGVVDADYEVVDDEEEGQ